MYLHLAVFTLLWAEVLLIHLVPWEIPTVEVVIFSLAGTALLVNLLLASVSNEKDALFRAGPPLAFLLSVVPVFLGIMLLFRATVEVLPEWRLADKLGLSYVYAMVATALSSRIGAYLYRHSRRVLSVLYFFGTMAATLLAGAGCSRSPGRPASGNSRHRC